MTDTIAPVETADDEGQGALPASAIDALGRLRQTASRRRTHSLAWRTAQLEGLIDFMTERESELIAALVSDLGRHPTEAYAADIGTTLAEIRHIERNVGSWMKPDKVRLPLTSQPGSGRVDSQPLGVVLVIAPWNYPIQLLVMPLAAALAAGNCVVAKPSEMAPATSAVIAEHLTSYLDPDAVTVIEGGVPETTELLAQPFDHIFFTGSTKVGKIVMRAAAEHLTPVTLELGGKSPAYVAADCDLDATAHRLVWGKFLNCGQTCIAPDYLLVDAAIRDRLVDKMVEVIAEFYGPDPAKSESYPKIINARQLDRLVELLPGGGKIVTGGTAQSDDRHLAPTIVVDPDTDSDLMTDEIFGPILPVLSVEGPSEAIEFINDRPKPLALYVYTDSDDLAERVLRSTTSGGACVNHSVVHILPHNLPFGGVGPSGMGAYHGKMGFDTFSHQRSVVEKPTWPDPPLLYPPYSDWKEKIIRLAFKR